MCTTMTEAFHFDYPLSLIRVKAKGNKKSQEDLLQNAIKTLEKLEYTGLAHKLKSYVLDRSVYVNNHAGKYVQITEDKIELTEKTVLDDKDLGKYAGILLKIGDEVASHDAAGLYSMAYNPAVSAYSVPVSFGYNGIKTHTGNTVVDTGCARTTFSTKVLDWIRHYNHTYAVELENINVIGGDTTVFRGKIDVEICGRTYSSLYVSYANIPHVALIGMDLINMGKLDIDSGLRMSFTYH